MNFPHSIGRYKVNFLKLVTTLFEKIFIIDIITTTDLLLHI